MQVKEDKSSQCKLTVFSLHHTANDKSAGNKISLQVGTHQGAKHRAAAKTCQRLYEFLLVLFYHAHIKTNAAHLNQHGCIATRVHAPSQESQLGRGFQRLLVCRLGLHYEVLRKTFPKIIIITEQICLAIPR